MCFSAAQALLAAKAGATFISPFVGRLDDVGFDGMALIADIRLIYDNYDFATQILAASVRHPMHVVEAAKIGADVMTAPPKIIWQLFKHPLTDAGSPPSLRTGNRRGRKSLEINTLGTSLLTFAQPSGVTLSQPVDAVSSTSSCKWTCRFSGGFEPSVLGTKERRP